MSRIWHRACIKRHGEAVRHERPGIFPEPRGRHRNRYERRNMKYFKLGSIMAMVALSFSLAQPAQAYIFGFSNGKQPFTLTLNPGTSDSKTLLSKDSGWYSDVVPIHISGYQNYIVAQPGDVDAAAYRNFFVFDISGLSSRVSDNSTATLTLFSYDVTSTATYTLYDVMTESHELIDGTTLNFPPPCLPDRGVHRPRRRQGLWFPPLQLRRGQGFSHHRP